jgi:hypothetical protein
MMTGEKVGIWKEKILAYFEVLAQHSPADAKITICHEKKWCKNGLRSTRNHCILMAPENMWNFIKM